MVVAGIPQIRAAIQGEPDRNDFVRSTNQQTLDALCQNAFGEYFGRRIQQGDFDIRIQKIRDVLPLEHRKVELNRGRIHQLYRQAACGNLSSEILRERGIEKHQQLSRPKSIRYSQIEEASAWVFDQSTTNQGVGAVDFFAKNKKKIARAQKRAISEKKLALTQAMWHVASTQKLVTSLDTLEYLHNHVGILNGQTRVAAGGSMYRFYGGTAIGRYLQGVVSDLASKLYSKASRYNVLWYDVAAMMMVGYIISHGFADGNGRACRAIFGCTLVQKRLNFYAPSLDWLNKNIASQYREDYGHPVAQ